MSKRLILILAMALTVGMTCAAYAEVQNIKVSGDLLVQAVARYNFRLTDFVSGCDAYDKGDGILSHVRVRLDADLTDNVAATVRLIKHKND